jgi:hypothetical protein
LKLQVLLKNRKNGKSIFLILVQKQGTTHPSTTKHSITLRGLKEKKKKKKRKKTERERDLRKFGEKIRREKERERER